MIYQSSSTVKTYTWYLKIRRAVALAWVVTTRDKGKALRTSNILIPCLGAGYINGS